MAELFQTLYSGIVLGSIYALMALGLTLVYGALRMLNMAHGALLMLGGYTAWFMVTRLGMHPIVGAVMAMIGVGALGVVLHVVLVRPLLDKPLWENNTLVGTLGVAIVIENLVLIGFGPRIQSMPALVDGSMHLGNITVTYHALTITVVAIVTLVILNAFLRFSRHGLAIRAISQNVDAACLMGVPVQVTFALVMGISAALGAMGGVLLTAIYFLSPTVGYVPMLKALLITILGGLGSAKGSMWAAYLIGLLEAGVSYYFGVKWALPALFLFMILLLVARPNGLFGLREERRM